MSGNTIGGIAGGLIGFAIGGPAGAQWGWMIGSVGHLMRQKAWVPFFWILRNKWGKMEKAAS